DLLVPHLVVRAVVPAIAGEDHHQADVHGALLAAGDDRSASRHDSPFCAPPSPAGPSSSHNAHAKKPDCPALAHRRSARETQAHWLQPAGGQLGNGGRIVAKERPPWRRRSASSGLAQWAPAWRAI